MKNLPQGNLYAIATAHAAIAVAQSAPLGHSPGTVHPKSMPVDPKAESPDRRAGSPSRNR